MPSEPPTDQVIVARRELRDLLYRCGRIGGIDAGTATEVATRWVDAAIAETSTTENVHQFGIPLRSEVFECLTRAAHGFLVSEAVLDDLSREGGGPEGRMQR